MLDFNGVFSATDAQYEDILRSIENADQAGEMFTSGAPYDPTFWPLHGSIERLIGYKRMNVALYGLTFDETWAYPEYDASNGAYLDGVCDWSDVTSDDEFPTCTSGEICSGHYEDDVLEFGNFLDEDEQYTNWEMYTFIHPWTEDLPYIYDTYDFDYCEEEGVYFISDDDTDDATTSEAKSVSHTTDKKSESKSDSKTSDKKSIKPVNHGLAHREITENSKAASRFSRSKKALPPTHMGKPLISQPKSIKFKPSKKTPKQLEHLKRKNKTLKRTKRNRPGMLEQMMKKSAEQQKAHAAHETKKSSSPKKSTSSSTPKKTTSSTKKTTTTTTKHSTTPHKSTSSKKGGN